MALALSIRIDADGKAAIVESKRVGDELGKIGEKGKRGGAQAAEGLKRVDSGASAASRSVGRLFAAFASFATLRAFSRTADDIANINARLQVVTKTQERYNVAQQQTFAIAQRTSSSLESTATLYGRLQRAIDDLGGSQAQALQLTETINQAFAVSGSTAAESSNAIIQFAQGLSAGALRGDEFNSVMEQAPRLAEALSTSLGVTRGQLREMAADGKLTAATIINAIQSQSAAIAEEFEKIPLTAERAWVRVKNAALLAVGEIEKASGSNQAFADFLNTVALQLPQITQSAIAFGQTVADQWSEAFNRAGEAAGGFFGDFQRNAGEILPAMIQTIIDGLAILPANIRLLVAQGAALFSEMSAAVQIAFVELRAGASQAMLAVESVASEVAGKVAVVFGEVFDAVIRRFGELTASIANGLDFVGLDEQAAGLRRLADGLKEAATFEEQYAREAKERGEAIKRASEETEQARQAEVRALLNQVEASKESVESFKQERAEALRLLQERRKLTDVTADLEDATGDLTETVDGNTESTERNRRAQERLRLVEIERRDAIENLERTERSFYGLQQDIAEYFGGPAVSAYNQHAQAVEVIRQRYLALVLAGELTTENAAEIVQAFEGVDARLEATLQNIAYESDRTAQEVDRAWNQAGDSIADAIGDFATGGIKSFEDFADTVKDIARRLVSDLISTFARNLFSGQGGNLGSLFGGASGGGGGLFGSLLGGIGSLFGGAGGGITAAAGTATGVTGTAATAGFGGANAAASGGGLGSLGSSFAGIPVVGWIMAGMALNQSLFSQGWAVGGGSTTLPNGATVSGGGDISTLGRILTAGPFGPEGIDRLLQGLGLSGSTASLLSGSAIHTALFGRKAPRLTNSELSFGFGPEGVSGSERYRTYEQGGVFRSSRRRWHDFELSDESAEYAQGIFDSIGMTIRNASMQLGSDAEVNFQAAMRVINEYNKEGEITATQLFVDVLGRSFAAATEEEALTRLGAEAIIAAIDASMGGVAEAIGQGIGEAAEQGGASGGGRLGETVLRDLKSAAVRGEASAIAERWRDDANKLMEGAQFLLSAAADINAGYALLGDESSLTQIADLTEELANEGETLLQTYQRMAVSTRLLEEALTLSNVTLDNTREEIVRLATEITEAAGGLDRASQLWSTYFSEFFSDQELAQVRLDAANQRRNTALEELGLDSSISNESFRAAFEEALPTLSADEIVTWLEAGEAIAMANAAQAAYNDTLEEAAEFVIPAALDALQAHLAALREAQAEYASFAAGLRREFEVMGLNEFQLEMREIGEWTKANVQRLNELAQAAGYAAAREEDLALVHQIAAARAAEAIARLTNAARSLVEQLFGGSDPAQALVDNTQNYIDTSLAGISQIGAATNQLYQSQLAGIQSIQAYLDAQLLGDTSSLTPAEQLAEARRQFEAAFQAALGGDADALNDITRLADILLRQGRAFDPSDYPELEAFVRGLLGQLTQIVPVDGGGPGGTDPGGVGTGVGTVGGVVGQVLDGTAQQVAEDRAALVAELVNMVRDLMEATGQSLSEVAASIGLNVQDFISELGINLSDLTVETTLQLAALSGQLGISLTELAGQVGVDLGELADAQSLLNQALGATIEGLPEEDRRVLQPLFQQIASATTAADANAAIATLTDAANEIGGDTALALQPFLEGINIRSELEISNGYLNTIANHNFDQINLLIDIRDRLGDGSGPGLPGTGTGGGGGGLPGTGSGGGLPGGVAQGTAQQVTQLLGGIIERLDRVEAATVQAGSQTVTAISGEQAKRLREAEKARDVALTARRA